MEEWYITDGYDLSGKAHHELLPRSVRQGCIKFCCSSLQGKRCSTSYVCCKAYKKKTDLGGTS